MYCLLVFQLLLSVYFESRCPDSKAFVLNQLRPALRLLPEHISLKLVPFGKARVSRIPLFIKIFTH